ncbi:hypothetical protein L1887_19733 [Cichorium endivia]|nr:hypothetical protein L1887_19733 [Cichorium endivia]
MVGSLNHNQIKEDFKKPKSKSNSNQELTCLGKVFKVSKVGLGRPGQKFYNFPTVELGAFGAELGALGARNEGWMRWSITKHWHGVKWSVRSGWKQPWSMEMKLESFRCLKMKKRSFSEEHGRVTFTRVV